jgi:hypothetical protein
MPSYSYKVVQLISMFMIHYRIPEHEMAGNIRVEEMVSQV